MDVSFSGLLWWGAGVSIAGLVSLVLLIPAIGCLTKSSDAKTEFYSARASYWCVVSGLVLVLVVE